MYFFKSPEFSALFTPIDEPELAGLINTGYFRR